MRLSTFVSTLAAALAATFVWSTSLHAAPPAGSDAIDETAKGLYDDGQAALVRSDWADCRAKLLAAWAITKHPQIAGPLGNCEVELGELRDGAEHLQIFLDDPPGDTPPARLSLARELLVRAKQGVATLVLTSNVPEAAIEVDGAKIDRDRSDAAPIYLAPGTHTVRGTHSGYEVATQSLTLAAGVERAVRLELRKAGAAGNGSGDSSSDRSYAPEIALWISGGVALVTGAVLLGVGVAQGGEASDTAAALKSESGRQYPCDAPAVDAARCGEVDDMLGQKEALVPAGAVGIGIGAALIAAAFVHLAVAEEDEDQADVTWWLGPGAGGLGLSLRY